MKFFVDTAATREIKGLAASGLPDGVTVNPSLSGRGLANVLADRAATGQTIA